LPSCNTQTSGVLSLAAAVTGSRMCSATIGPV
jgi:hypothetical protein